MRRLAERSTELAAEVGRRQPSRASHVSDAERLAVAGIGEILRPHQMAARRQRGHTAILAAAGERSRAARRSRPAIGSFTIRG